MYFSHAQLNPDAFRSAKFWQQVSANEYEAHRQIWSLFGDGPERKRDFLYRREEKKGPPTFYIVSAREPRNESDLWRVQTKAYSPVLRAGQRLAFMLRANPVCKKKGDRDKQSRHDVVMEEKRRLKQAGVPASEWPPAAELIQKVGVAWLEKRSEANGFSIEHLLVDGYSQQRFRKGQNDVCISTLDLSGILNVTDPGLLSDALTKGIGPAKGFGCGLMLVRRL